MKYVVNCRRDLPSDHETFGEHISDSMYGCVADELFP